MGSNGFISRGCSHMLNDAADAHYCNSYSCSKLNIFDWLEEIPSGKIPNDLLEV